MGITIFESLSFLIETIKLYLVMRGILLFKDKNKMVLLVCTCFSTLAIAELSLCIKGNNLMYISEILVIIVVAFNITGKKKYLFATMSYIFICMIDMIIASAVMFFMKFNIEDLQKLNIFNLLGNSISIILIIIVILIRQKYIGTKKILGKLDKKDIVTTIVRCIILGLYIALIQMIGFENKELSSKSIIAFCVSMCGVLFIIIVVMLLQSNNEKKHYKELSDKTKELVRCQENYYCSIMEREEETRKFRHDISEHLYCIQILLKDKKYNELEYYLHDMTGKMIILNPKIKSGNTMIDVLIADLLNQYGEKKIEVKWIGRLSDRIKLSDMDLCTIFSNIISNAVNAISDFEKERVIEVVIKQMNTSLYIIVKNSVTDNIKIKKNKLVSLKIDKKNHGFGSKNIEECVKRYNGSVKYNCFDKIFTVEIIIPNGIEIE